MTPDIRDPRKIVCSNKVDGAQVTTDGIVWIDLKHPSDQVIDRLGSELALHPLTVEDLQSFSQRAKAEDYEKYAYLVVFGAAGPEDSDRVAEVHMVVGRDFVITVSRDKSNDLERLHREVEGQEQSLLGLARTILDQLIDSWGPLLDELDAQIEGIEARIADRRLKDVELELHGLRRLVGRINRLVHRESEVLTRLPAMLHQVLGTDGKESPYFRDVLDHLLRVAESTDAMRDRIVGTFELYMAAINNRQNLTMKQFTVIAGIFLPLTFVTGFYGMNFAWMVDHIASSKAFAVLGVAIPLVVAAGLLGLFYKRGLFRE